MKATQSDIMRLLLRNVRCWVETERPSFDLYLHVTGERILIPLDFAVEATINRIILDRLGHPNAQAADDLSELVEWPAPGQRPTWM